MELELIYEKKEDVPEAHANLYTETDGKWNLTGIKDMKTKADVDKVQVALGKERTDHKASKAKVAIWADMDKEKVDADLAELTELRAAAEAGEGGKDAKEKYELGVKAAADARVTAEKVKSDREIADLKKVGGEKDEKILGFENDNRILTITDAVKKAARTSKVIETAVDDVMMLAERVFEINEEGLVLVKDQVGYTPGIAPDIWLSEMQEKRPHWWPVSTGGGAGGGTGGTGFAKNPWSGDHWNLTEQAKAIKGDRSKAERMAAAAGTAIGGVRPAVKAKA